MQATIDLDILDQGEENPFERLMSAYERVKLQAETGSFSNDFEKKILYLERVLQDLSDKKDDISNYIISRSKEILSAYSVVIDKEQSLWSLDLIQKSLDSISTVIGHSHVWSERELNIEFDNLSPSKYLRTLDINNPTFEQLKQAAFCSVYHPGVLDILSTDFTTTISPHKKDHRDIWDISLNFSTSKFDNHRPLAFINVFVEILLKIDGVDISIEDIKIGSVKAKLRVEFQNEDAKEEFKNVLEESIHFLKESSKEISNKLEDTFDQSSFKDNNLVPESDKNEKLQTAYLIALRIKIAEEELKNKRLENESLRLKIMQETIDTNSKLLANTFMSQKDYEILIKGIPFLKVLNGQIQIGESTRIIDDL